MKSSAKQRIKVDNLCTTCHTFEGMQPKKKKEKRISRTPEEIAKHFWIDFYEKLQDRCIQAIIDHTDASPAEKKHSLSYIALKRSRPDDEPVGGLDDLMIEHLCMVAPYLPWDKINRTLAPFHIDNQTIQTLIFFLKPAAIEQRFLTNENLLYAQIMEGEKTMCNEFNRKIKLLSPLVKRLKNLQSDKAYEAFGPLQITILILENDIELYREIVKQKRIRDKRYHAVYGIDKDPKKSPQKHKYWNFVVSRALKILNPFFHGANCERPCKKTHQKAITTIAELLKILYPKIWKEDVQTIAFRIKQKDYRSIPA